MQDAQKQSRAVVIGASVAGSMLAKVLSSRFREVLLIDRDTFPDDASPRATVPQEHHIHLLLQRGKRNMEKLYPGFLAALERAGAEVVDLSHGVKWFNGGRWKNRWPTGITAHYCSRTLVEYTLRDFAKRIPNVRLQDGLTVQEPLIDEESKAVIGVRVTDGAGVSSDIHADLVIDASGRGTAMATWLAKLGHGEVEAEQVVTQLGYVSRIYKRNPKLERHWRVLLITPRLPFDRRMTAISPIEGGRLMVTTGGWFGAFPEPTEDSFMAFLKSLPVPDAYDAVGKCEPAGDFKRFRMPGGLRRRYDRCESWPKGLLVVGDAVCSINPIYSQGMSVSSMQVEVFEEKLDCYLAGDCTAQDIFTALIQATERSWQQAKGGDERLPELSKRPNLRQRLQGRYLDEVVTASAESRIITMALLKVSNLIAPDKILFRPEIAWEAARGMLARAVQPGRR